MKDVWVVPVLQQVAGKGVAGKEVAAGQEGKMGKELQGKQLRGVECKQGPGAWLLAVVLLVAWLAVLKVAGKKAAAVPVDVSTGSVALGKA